MTTRIGPLVEDEPRVVRIGESWKPLVTIYDGVKTDSAPFGAVVDLSAATISANLRVYKPDGSDNAVVAGTKVDAGANGQVRFDFADTVTALWSRGVYSFEVEYTDTGPTPDDVVLVTIGSVDAREKPSAGGQ